MPWRASGTVTGSCCLREALALMLLEHVLFVGQGVDRGGQSTGEPRVLNAVLLCRTPQAVAKNKLARSALEAAPAKSAVPVKETPTGFTPEPKVRPGIQLLCPGGLTRAAQPPSEPAQDGGTQLQSRCCVCAFE